MQDLRNRIKLALIYPLSLIIAGSVAMGVFMTVLVPQMTKLFAKTGGQIPLSTQILMLTGKLVQSYGLPLLVFMALAGALFVAYVRRTDGKRWWHQAQLRLPLMGPLLTAAFYTQFCQTMANLLQNGLPLLTALKLMSRATGNVFFQAQIIRITDLVGEGASLTRSMKAVGHFPPNLRDLVKVGEQIGDLGGTLEKVGQRYDKLIQLQVDRIMTIFQAMHGLQSHRMN
jgi:general secretion pathway protein F/type IV pilus assembly protein PilC